MSFQRLAPEHHDTLDGIPEPSEHGMMEGHEEALAHLAGAHRAGRLPHAVLLAGPRGIGKATLAFRLSLHLLAHPQPTTAPAQIGRADPDSGLFRQVASAAHPSVLHLTRPPADRAKGFKSVITVEEIRRVGHFLSMTAHDGGYKVVIVDPVDDMNASAANALLKNLEEPPARTLFLLISHAPGSLLPTIRSRCQMLTLHGLTATQLDAVLAGLGIGMPEQPGRRQAIVEAAGGSVREAILLADHGGLEIAETIAALAEAPRLDAPAAHRLADVAAAREPSTRFDLFNQHALQFAEDRAARAARAGDTRRAGRLAGLWQDLRIAIDEAETYNLDRKQHALNMILRLHETLRM